MWRLYTFACLLLRGMHVRTSMVAMRLNILGAVSPLQHGVGEEEDINGLQGLRREGTGGSPEDKLQKQKQQRRAQQGHAKEAKVSRRCETHMPPACVLACNAQPGTGYVPVYVLVYSLSHHPEAPPCLSQRALPKKCGTKAKADVDNLEDIVIRVAVGAKGRGEGST